MLCPSIDQGRMLSQNPTMKKPKRIICHKEATKTIRLLLKNDKIHI